jgi:hypothetical protein
MMDRVNKEVKSITPSSKIRSYARVAYLTFPGVYGARGWLARTDDSAVGTENRKSGIVRPR